jgi:hypothetical protein
LGDLEMESLASASRQSRFAPALPKSFVTLDLADHEFIQENPLTKITLRRAAPWRGMALSLSVAAVLFFAFLSTHVALAGWRAPALNFLPALESASAHRFAGPETDLALQPPISKLPEGTILKAPSFLTPWRAPEPYLEVRLPAGTTLRHLSLEYVGRFDISTQKQIWALNPEIIDPNHVPAGQMVRLPVGRNADSPSLQTTSTSPREVQP